MFGFLFGAACLLGLTATFAGGRHHAHYYSGGHRFGGFRSGRGRFILHRLLDRLDTTPGQEKVIRQAVDTLLDDVRDARGELRETRTDVARAVRAETLDRAAFDSVFEHQDQVIERVRQNALDSFGKVHETLDERQRSILAELIEAGPFARGCGAFH